MTHWVLIIVFQYTCITPCVALTSQQITGFTTLENCLQAGKEFEDDKFKCVEVK